MFIGATNYDRKLRAFNKAAGKPVWEATLPAGGNATPSAYPVDGRQFVGIAAGGGKADGGTSPSAAGNVAFALPK